MGSNGHAWGNERILTFLKEGRRLHKILVEKSSDRSFPPPRFISCWISEWCNCDCSYCFFSETNADKTHGYIDAKKFLSWLLEAKDAGAEAIEFSGGGEPTLHPDFQDIYEDAWAMGYHLGLITHACNPMPLEDMVQQFKYIRCGLDAATAVTHDAIKRNKRKNYWFYKAIENIKELVRLRDHKDPGCEPNKFTVGIKIILNMINCHELGAMIDMAADLKVDYIQIKHEHSSDNAIDGNRLDDLQHLADIKGNFMAESRTKILCSLSRQQATVKCFMSPIHTVVTATGKILQCCFFESRPIGTIFQSFSEVWGGRQHRAVIEQTTVEECSRIDCRWHYYNYRMREIIEDPLVSASFI